MQEDTRKINRADQLLGLSQIAENDQGVANQLSDKVTNRITTIRIIRHELEQEKHEEEERRAQLKARASRFRGGR